jgi:proteasome lid subunit RPN8/RPN11
MTDSCSEGLLGTWVCPECPFKIAYSFRALDDIRLAVTDAFFSLPRGGAEIGGILLGKRDAQQVTILDHVALDCEHALGPSFTLSPRDLAHLSVLLEEARKNPPERQPIGWYHSHTRSEIFLSEADLEIHKRYFAAPWQVALVLKPHTFHPTKGGFFFRDAEGNFHAEASYQEFVLEPLPMRPMPNGTIPRPSDAGNGGYLDPQDSGRAITLPATVVAGSDGGPEPAATGGSEAGSTPPQLGSQSELDFAGANAATAPAGPLRPVLVRDPQRDTAADEVPIHFPDLDARPRWRIAALLGLAACLAIGAFGFETRQMWLPRIFHGSSTGAVQPPATPPLGLVLTDRDGQLQIRWDPKSPGWTRCNCSRLRLRTSGKPRRSM